MKKVTLEQLKDEGWIEVVDGGYLQTQENIISDQKAWDEMDEAKKMDLTEYPIWMTTDDGHIDGYNSLEEFYEDRALEAYE